MKAQENVFWDLRLRRRAAEGQGSRFGVSELGNPNPSYKLLLQESCASLWVPVLVQNRCVINAVAKRRPIDQQRVRVVSERNDKARQSTYWCLRESGGVNIGNYHYKGIYRDYVMRVTIWIHSSAPVCPSKRVVLRVFNGFGV